MNVLFYTDYSISPNTGGIGRVTSTLVPYFKKEFGWKVFSIYAAPAPENCQVIETESSICLRLHDRLGLRKETKHNITKAVDFIAENKIDAIIIQTSVDVPAKLRKELDKRGLKDVPIYFCLHFCPGADAVTYSSVNHFGRAKGWLRNILSASYDLAIRKATEVHYGKAYLNSRNVILLSPSYIDLYRSFAGIAGRDKFVVISNPLAFCNTSDIAIQDKENKLLIVGRLEETYKRISAAIDIWSELEDIYEDWSLDIIGDGPSFSMYKELIESRKLKRCNLLGRQNPEEYYRRSKIFLMTSSSEGFPMTILEAQQFGCVPVVYNAFPALKDVLTDGRNGLIVRNNDNAAYISAIERLISDPSLLQQLSSFGAEDCVRFNLENVALKWKELLLSRNEIHPSGLSM